MRTLLVDRDTADRLLSGLVAPDDAPPGYAAVAEILRSCTQLPPADLVRERTTIVAMTQRIRSHRPANPPALGRVAVRRPVRLKLIGVGVGAMLVGTSGLAFAGELPAPAQRIAHTVFASIGVDIPVPEYPASTDDPVESRLPISSGSPTAKGLAKNHVGRAGAHGAIVSSEASDGRSRAGQPHGQWGQPPGQSGQPPGQSGQPPGQSGQPPGQSGQPPGQSGQPHGQSDATHPARGRSNR
jgi:hypothetical protein